MGACILWEREVAWESDRKKAGQVRVRCLEKPFGVNMPQNMEWEHEAAFHMFTMLMLSHDNMEVVLVGNFSGSTDLFQIQ